MGYLSRKLVTLRCLGLLHFQPSDYQNEGLGPTAFMGSHITSPSLDDLGLVKFQIFANSPPSPPLCLCVSQFIAPSSPLPESLPAIAALLALQATSSHARVALAMVSLRRPEGAYRQNK